jgi:hypothetical protein
MNRKNWIGAFVGIALLACGTEKLYAQSDISEPVTFAATIMIQNTNTDINLNPETPLKLKMATKDVLALIAKAEFSVTNYPSTNFPSGAKLVKTGTFGADSLGAFSVWDRTTNVLLSDVSDLIGFNNVDIGVFTATGSVGSTSYAETDYGLAEIYIFDLNYGGSTDLTLDGYLVNTIKISAPNTSGLMQNTQSFTVKAFGGTGSVGTTNDTENAAASGSFTAKGTAKTTF